jgi:hypothetical protein
MDYNHNSEELIQRLQELKDSNIEEFTNLILAAFRVAPDHVVEDPHPSEHKLRALNSMLEYLETTERYEDCAFVKTIIDKINEY